MNQALIQATPPPRLLSIVTVTRNDSARLALTLRSMGRFYGDARFEHIVMDGKSTDNTHELVAPLAGTANFLFHSGSDKGIYDAMNQGVAKSNGRFLLFLNCGDCMQAGPDELAGWIEQLGGQESVDIACFSFSQVESSGHTKVVHAHAATPMHMPTSHQAMLFAAGFIRSHPYDIRYKIAADFDLYMRSRRQCVVLAPTQAPLTIVEVDGVASSQPMISYREYLAIASRNLTGLERVSCVIRIGFRAMIVIAVKSLLPTSLVSKLRGMS
ncbi:glycosyltransferase [Herbaspirillum sp. LeCh32-8]|uniref:glycosyltransferase n=1 Tax=Herbaspirillum sp. LeCh32-8 TaxID=2821356 RepID=UPI001AE2320D|nr:glycosyltransferase [Herbaspirillum sp. LeCh32-8]MBP0598339.1 glycosyltransferase [Herbaspirillum sp. LeCh32-8]